jgi:hypothetical protein
VYHLAFYPILIVGFGVYLEIDAVSLFDQYLFSSTTSWRKHFENTAYITSFILFMSKIGAHIIPVHTTCRICSLVLSFTAFSTHLGLATIHLLHIDSRSIASLSYVRLNKYFAKNYGIQLIILIASDIIGGVVVGLMLIGFVVGVALNFVSLKMYHAIPMPFYLYFPSVAILILITTEILLKMAVDININSKKMVRRKWKQVVVNQHDRKYVGRKIRATRVLRLDGWLLGYKIYECTQSTRVSYYEAILIYTINALLSIDTSQMKPIQL